MTQKRRPSFLTMSTEPGSGFNARRNRPRSRFRTRRGRSREARKARNHALMVAGGLIVNHAPCGNWKRIDWDRLAA